MHDDEGAWSVGLCVSLCRKRRRPDGTNGSTLRGACFKRKFRESLFLLIFLIDTGLPPNEALFE